MACTLSFFGSGLFIDQPQLVIKFHSRTEGDSRCTSGNGNAIIACMPKTTEKPGSAINHSLPSVQQKSRNTMWAGLSQNTAAVVAWHKQSEASMARAICNANRGDQFDAQKRKKTYFHNQIVWKATKGVPKSEGYQNQSFSSVLSGPFPPTLFPSFLPPLSPSGPVHSRTTSPLFSSPPPSSPFFDSRKSPI